MVNSFTSSSIIAFFQFTSVLGGTNFGRTSGYLTTTSYDYDAPVDEFGVPNEPKYTHLSKLNGLLNKYSDLLLSSGRPTGQNLNKSVTIYSYPDSKENQLVFLCNDDANSTAIASFGGNSYQLSPLSVVIIGMSFSFEIH